MSICKIILAAALMLPLISHAKIIPVKQGLDAHVVKASYNPHNVIQVKTKIGIATLIQLSPNENILSESSGLGMGDATAWGLSVRGNNIFLKPIMKNPSTNLTIVSNLGRTYIFELVESYHPYYFLQITYPKKIAKHTPKPPSYPCSQGARNWSWLKWGNNKLSPQYTWSDGQFTCMKFNKNVELPLVYVIGSDGQETLANFHIERDTMVIHSPANEFRLRLGKQVLGIKTTNEDFYKGYNADKSTNNRKRHIRIGEDE